ncbi:MAG: hypothetical protein V5A64_07240 [Candidatus Thermoplasmatota archaeon]
MNYMGNGMSNLNNAREVPEGAMVRQLSGEIRDSIREEILDLYRDKDGNLEGFRESCAEWHWKTVLYIDKEDREDCVAYIISAFQNKRDLNDDKTWRDYMLYKMPSDAVDKIWDGAFTQVPKLAIYNQTPLLRKKKQSDEELGVFSMPLRD